MKITRIVCIALTITTLLLGLSIFYIFESDFKNECEARNGVYDFDTGKCFSDIQVRCDFYKSLGSQSYISWACKGAKK